MDSWDDRDRDARRASAAGQASARQLARAVAEREQGRRRLTATTVTASFASVAVAGAVLVVLPGATARLGQGLRNVIEQELVVRRLDHLGLLQLLAHPQQLFEQLQQLLHSPVTRQHAEPVQQRRLIDLGRDLLALMSESSARPGKSAEVDAQPEFVAWRALGMLIQLGVTDQAGLARARELLADDLAALDLACSRFRPDSELVAVGNAARGAPGPLTRPGQRPAGRGGRGQPAGGRADRRRRRPHGRRRPGGARLRPGLRRAPGRGDTTGNGRSSRQRPNDPRLAFGLGRRRGRQADGSGRRPARPWRHRQGLGGRLLGGENRRPPRLRRPRQPGRRHRGGRPAAREAGWPIRVQDTTLPLEDSPDGPSQVVSIRSGGLATSSTAARRWHHGGDVLHHILDPRTGLPGRPGLADGLGRRRDLRRRQHRGDRRDHQRSPGAGLAGEPQPPRPPGLGRRGDHHRRQLAGQPEHPATPRRQKAGYPSSMSQSSATAAVHDWCSEPSGAPVSGW